MCIYIWYFSSVAFEAVRGNDKIEDRRLTSSISEINSSWEATHFRRDGICAIRVSTDGKVVHGLDHDEDFKHSRRSGDAQAFR